MSTRNQQYAAKIFEQVAQIRDAFSEEQRKKYGSMAHRLPVLVRTAGLAQALGFLDARGTPAQKKFLEHLDQVVNQEGGATLLEQSRGAQLTEYMLLTRKVLAALLWYKRFAQSVLGVEPGEGTEGGENE